MAQHKAVERAQAEREALEGRVAELQRDASAGQSEAVESKERLAALQDEMAALREEVLSPDNLYVRFAREICMLISMYIQRMY